VASTHHRWELPFPRRRYPPGHEAKFYPIPEDDPQDLEWADDDAYSEYSQDDDNEDDIYGASEHLPPPPPPVSIPIYNPDRLNYDIGGDDDSIEESSRIPKKKGPRVDDRFPLPPLGDLNHPYIDWVIDKVTMDEYMLNYAKQEGFALTRTKDGTRIRWRCVHAGRYRNRNNLPAEVTENERRQELQDAGSVPFGETNA